MATYQPIDAFIEEGFKLFVEPNQVSVDKRLVGTLMYLAHTCLHLAYALSIVSLNLGEC